MLTTTRAGPEDPPVGIRGQGGHQGGWKAPPPAGRGPHWPRPGTGGETPDGPEDDPGADFGKAGQGPAYQGPEGKKSPAAAVPRPDRIGVAVEEELKD